MDEDAISFEIRRAAFKVHTALGPGLLESVALVKRLVRMLPGYLPNQGSRKVMVIAELLACVRMAHLEGAQKVPCGASGSESPCQVRFWRVAGVQEFGKERVNEVRLSELAISNDRLSLTF